MLTLTANTYTPISFTVPVDAISAVWTLVDDFGATLVDSQPVSPFDATSGTITVSVPAAMNLITAVRASRAARVVTLDLITPAGATSLDVTYLLTSKTSLVLCQNSFQTYEGALVARAGIGQILPGWDSTTDRAMRSAALETAYRRLGQLAYKFTLDVEDSQEYDLENPLFDYTDGIYQIVRQMQNVTTDEFALFPVLFVDALTRAQVVEADTILGGDVIGSKRMAGVVLEKVGESTTQFRTGNGAPLDLPVGPATLRELTGFVFRRYQVMRG